MECKYKVMYPEDSTSAVHMPHRGSKSAEKCGNKIVSMYPSNRFSEVANQLFY